MAHSNIASLQTLTEDEALLKETGTETCSFRVTGVMAGFHWRGSGREHCRVNLGYVYSRDRPYSIVPLNPLVARFAQEQVLPKVAQMDESEKLDKDVLKGLFEQGVGLFFGIHESDSPRSHAPFLVQLFNSCSFVNSA